MARTTVNVIGNGLASVVVARWEGVFGTEDPAAQEDGPLPVPALETSPVG
jgi:Na+/H+-dicarboxylate symporter